MKYIIAVDGNDASRHATAFVRSFVRPTDSICAFCAAKQNTPTDGIIQSAMNLFSHLPASQRSAVVEPGSDLVDGLRRASTEVDVVVCGSRGHNQLKRSILGSVSTEIVAGQTVGATLVVHQPPLDYGQSYLLCVDGSDYSRRAAQVLTQILQPEDVVVIWYGFIPPALLVLRDDQLIRNANYGTVWEGMEKRGIYFVEEAVQTLIDSKTIHPQNIFSKVDACADPKSDVIAFADINNIKTLVVGAKYLQVGPARRPALSSFVSHLIHNATKHAVLVVKGMGSGDPLNRSSSSDYFGSPERGASDYAPSPSRTVSCPTTPNHEGEAP
eukprot:TRINITY_DN4951_c0_g1_i1.p1 TRINITY_DN4951_c0_g1~~TRINITY_DN4951_c0_g1_i1.p1  ORF type:complete len:327 (-),score=40.24 TRINITY_DN4951_c0_g1_i1:203-1183(-)